MAPLITRYAQKSAPEAAQWAISLPPVEQTAAVQELMVTWMRQNSVEASQWLTNLLPGDSRDSAIVSLVNSPVLENDHTAALSWANSVSLPSLRENLIRNIEEGVQKPR